MLSISWETDYAFLILNYIAHKEGLVTISELVREVKVPKQFTANIASKLVKHGILVSKEGKTGGYSLARPLLEITAYEIVSIFEKNLELVSCQKEDFSCPLEANCSHRIFFRHQLAGFLSNELKKWTLEKIYTKTT